MPEAALAAHLRYLEEKGFLKVERRSGFGFRVAFACLTARGWDHIDGLDEGEGVDTEL